MMSRQSAVTVVTATAAALLRSWTSGSRAAGEHLDRGGGHELTWALATFAVLLIGYAAVSRRLDGVNVSGAMFFATTGLLVGPVLGLLDLHLRGEQVKLLAEIIDYIKVHKALPAKPQDEQFATAAPSLS